MPQHRSKQAGQLPFGKKKQQGSTPTPGADASANEEPSWQRGQGGFSGKAKKEYLQWKRQQKEAAAASDSDDGCSNTIQAGSTERTAGSRQISSAEQTSVRHDIQQQTTAPGGSTDDPAQRLRYRPLVAVPAAPYTTAAVADNVHDASSSASAADVSAASNSDAVLQANAADVAYMPVLDPAEVGFTEEGFQLNMPTRPAWQGVVNSADELHALEEQQFQAWQESLLATAVQGTCTSASCSSSSAGGGLVGTAQQQTARAGGVGRLSFYEGRLEFWRQLWRTLEMSDIVIMIVDARNPLLHFSHALYRHITQDHKLPLLLLLNKCDLIPAVAAAAWQTWLQQQLPGVTVLPVSAAAGAAEAAAQQVLGAVLQQRVERGGQKVLVQEFVGKSIEELMVESLQRNVHAKRHVMQQQGSAAAAAAATADDSRATSTESAAEPAAYSDAEGHVKPAAALSADSDDSDGDWSLKPGRRAGARKGSKRGASRNLNQQQHWQQQVRQIQGGTASRAGHQAAAAALDKPWRGAAAVAAVDEAQGSSVQQQEADSAADSDTAAFISEPDSEADEQLSAMNNMLEELTLERQVSRTASLSRSYGAAESTGSAAAATAVADAACTAGTANAEVDAALVPVWQLDSRPVVIGLLGEPNVGKSSTLNVLLGTHRVAVSCHPGRTKHYQTHFMNDRLVLCDCPGIVFPRLDVSLPMQVLFGSYPIASCRQPYAVLRYLASASWPRLQQKLGLRHPGQLVQQQQQQQSSTASSSLSNGNRERTADADFIPGQATAAVASTDASSIAHNADDADAAWSPWTLCEALCEKRSWVLPRSGRLDTYRAANWMLRAALGGKQGLGLAFMPPSA